MGTGIHPTYYSAQLLRGQSYNKRKQVPGVDAAAAMVDGGDRTSVSGTRFCTCDVTFAAESTGRDRPFAAGVTTSGNNCAQHHIPQAFTHSNTSSRQTCNDCIRKQRDENKVTR